MHPGKTVINKEIVEIMEKYLKKQFPDLCKQTLMMDKVYSRTEIENKVLGFSKVFAQKAIAYNQSGKKVCVYTSETFTNKLSAMKKGDKVLDKNTKEEGMVVSDEPFFCSCTLCIRVDFGNGSQVYDCAYFM